MFITILCMSGIYAHASRRNDDIKDHTLLTLLLLLLLLQAPSARATSASAAALHDIDLEDWYRVSLWWSGARGRPVLTDTHNAWAATTTSSSSSSSSNICSLVTDAACDTIMTTRYLRGVASESVQPSNSNCNRNHISVALLGRSWLQRRWRQVLRI